MRAFVIKISLFIFTFIMIISLLFIFSRYFINYKANFKLKGNPHCIIVGNSHPEYAFNDQLIQNFKNLGHSGESYLYTYVKLRKVIKSNPDLACIFIEFGNINIGEKPNSWTWDDSYLSYRYPIYSPFMGVSEQKLILKNNPIGLIKMLPITLKNRIIQIFIGDFKYESSIGGYKSWTQTLPDSFVNATAQFRINRMKDYLGISEVNLYYLDKILELCKNNHVKVYLIRSPIHEKSNGYYNEMLFQQLLKGRYNKVPFLDFSKFPILDDEVGDYRHLNQKGSLKFSLWFKELMKDFPLDSLPTQNQINAEILNFQNADTNQVRLISK